MQVQMKASTDILDIHLSLEDVELLLIFNAFIIFLKNSSQKKDYFCILSTVIHYTSIKSKT